LKRGSNDVGWDYGVLVDAKNLDRLKCKLCGKVYSGGIYRMKQHIGHIKGNVASCPKSTKEDQAKCQEALLAAKNKKKEKKKDDKEIREEVDIFGDQQLEDDEVEVVGSRKRPHYLGPMDKFASTINPDSSSTDANKKMR
jgi:hypothetical protein